MSINKDKYFGGGVPFTDAWERILKSTDIKSLNDLGKILGKRQQTISASKQKNLFPYGWAYPVADKYGLLTEWILTGKGPKRLDDIVSKSEYNFPILSDFDEWLKDIQIQNPEIDRNVWLAGEMIDNIKSYREWKLRKDQEKDEEQNSISYKIA